jgi:hypothetical protein
LGLLSRRGNFIVGTGHLSIVPSTVEHANRAPRDRPRQVLTWAVIVLILAALIVIVIEAIRNEPASAPTGGSTGTANITLAASSDHLYSHTDEGC